MRLKYFVHLDIFRVNSVLLANHRFGEHQLGQLVNHVGHLEMAHA